MSYIHGSHHSPFQIVQLVLVVGKISIGEGDHALALSVVQEVSIRQIFVASRQR